MLREFIDKCEDKFEDGLYLFAKVWVIGVCICVCILVTVSVIIQVLRLIIE